jgi:CubicO group peptidase (beta-lactamase class C family)
MIVRPADSLVQRIALPVVLALGLLLAPGPSRGADTESGLSSTRVAIRALIQKEMQAHDVIGLSIALIDDQTIAWSEGFGYADRERRIAARADTLYTTGGLSQLLTAAAALQLVEQGAISLDRPVREYLPDFSIRSRFRNAPAITPRNLLSHHAGLPAMQFRNMLAADPEPLARFVADLRDEYTAFPPNEVFSPSLPGYDVVGRLIEEKCAKPFAECMQARLLAPLGMTQSGFDAGHADPARLAVNYWKQKPLAALRVRDLPAAGLVSSVTELGHFVQMLFAGGRFDGKAILRPQSIAEMLRVQNSNVPLDLDTRVGLAWRLSGVSFPQARRVAWLNNDSPYARGRILILPEQKVGVIVLTNCSGSSEAAERISERLLQLVLQERQLPKVVEPRHAALTTVASRLSSDQVRGNYATTLGLITVSGSRERYDAEMFGKTLRLNPQPEGLYAPEYRFLGLIPIPISVLKEVRLTAADIDGHQVIVAYYRDHAHRIGEKIAPVRLSESWLRRLGTYQPADRDPLLDLVKLGNVTLAYTDGMLYFRYRVPGWLGLVARIPVRPVSDTDLVIDGTGWLMGETIRVVRRDGKEYLRYSGYEFRRVGS